MCQQGIRSLAQVLERQIRALSDVKQGVRTISVIKHPQHGHLPRASVLPPPIARYRLRLPSCGSPFGSRFR